MVGPVIITRAEPGNSETKARIAALGFEPVAAPMLRLEMTGQDVPPLENVQGLIFTSANGVRAFGEVSARRDLTAWCVGPATLEAARQMGFERLEHGNGNGRDLLELICAKATREGGGLLHIANSAAAGELVSGLVEAGFVAEFVPLYEAVPAERLGGDTIEALERACVVLVHSAKGAAAFGARVADRDLSRHGLVGISEAACAPLSALGFGQIETAARPNEDALVDALVRLSARL